MESNRERFLRMAEQTRAHAARVSGRLRDDFLEVAKIWEAMAADEAERERKRKESKESG